MNQIRFRFSLRLEVGEVLIDLGLVLVLGFVSEDDGLGRESMGDGVAGGSGFAGRGNRAVGFGAVGAGGVDSAL